MNSKTCGHIYFLTNPSLSGLIKIGYTERELNRRIHELRGTGVPTPFVLIAAFYVHLPKSVEGAIHRHLRSYRIKRDREFFKIAASKALDMCAGIIYPALACDEAEESLKSIQSTQLSQPHCTLLELAFGATPFYDLLEIYSSDYDTHHQIVQSYVDDLVELCLLKKTKYGYELTPAGRKTCFNHPGVDLGAYLEAPSSPSCKDPRLDYLESRD
ncbi:GIY-YIG nuclease family protein [Coraliomargarita sp. SDUM461004]|uniref:GIY-YIG nuclease family protein n=1 Tax=Thalassobacterium sedimentorum TaxID=3041258 RepID=A0ABU1AJ67_9BACT|nr:GIY-YIG nuclease family protein [Coraliomargarita sp. SDUM461004]MDQ8193658.1 GIY-YIG nuclease family protein [Coraliomargarita sp. SDUM461004]